MTTKTIQANPELVRQELEKRKAFKSFKHFVHNYCMMWMKSGGDAIHFHLWDFQKDAADIFQNEQKVIVLKARQMGMSWLAMAYVVWCVLTKSNFHVYITSLGMREVAEQMERIRFIWYHLPEYIKGDVQLGGRGYKDNDSLIEFSNGSAVHAIATTKSAGHGAAPGLYILDEFARKDGDILAWRAIKPSLGKKSQVLIISTSFGFNNLFAELWFGAVSKSNEFTPVFFSADQHPDYSPEYLEEMKRDFAGDLQGYMEAFPMKPEDAFLSSSKGVFDMALIKEWKEYIRENNIIAVSGTLERTVVEDAKKRLQEKVVFEEDEAAQLLIWKHPEPDHLYSIGVDLAEGLVQGDYTVAAVLDATSNEIVALHRGKISPEYFSYALESLGRYYNNAWIAIEINMNASLLVEDLKASYPWLYCRMVREKLSDKPTPVVGFRSSGTSKPRIIMQYRREFSHPDKPLRIYSDTILDEMASFEDDSGKLGAAKGLYDDCVMAVAIAIEAKTTMPTQRAGVGRHLEKSLFGIQTKTRRNWRSL